MTDDPTDRDEDLFDGEDDGEDTAQGLGLAVLAGDGATIGDMSPRDFARLGVNQIAYVRAVREPRAEADPADARPEGADDGADDGSGDEANETPATRWAIHAANGQRIGMAPSPELAFAATRQHDMEPLSVH
jgi:hypothetical protein